ncbi:MAG: DUF1559 domain-containing protein [Planctomycetaceae bacterium]
MGATDGNGFVNPVGRVGNCCNCCGGQQATGQVVDGNIFGPTVAYNMASLRDGTSNIIIVGEHSDFIWDAAGTKTVQVSGTHGILMGGDQLLRIRDRPISSGHNWGRQFNMTTVRFPPNARVVNNDPAWPGVGDNYGSNNPLNSAHPGGVQVLMGDDVVKFVSENIDMLTFRRALTRDDGQPVGQF